MSAKTIDATPAQKSLHAAQRAFAAAAAALGPAQANLDAATQAVTDANGEAFAALTTKSTNPAAARDRIQTARAAIKTADDDLEWAQLQMQAAEVVHGQAHAAEQAARRAVVVDEYLAELDRFNDPRKRENVLLDQLQSVVTELTVALCNRAALHHRLASEWAALPDDERPRLKTGPLQPSSTIPLRGEFIDDLHPEVADVLKKALGDAAGDLRRRGW